MLHAHRTLLQRIDEEMRQTAQWTGRDCLCEPVHEAMERVARHEFVSAEQRPFAYDNRPLPIGHGQTISQPFIVALMIELLDPQPRHTVLEVGTGCGYACAVLAEVVSRVYTVERIGELAEQARTRLAEFGYANVEVRHGDGYEGWPEHAPFDGIVVAAAAPEVPEGLVAQLAPHGRMVVPVGVSGDAQELLVVSKDSAGAVTRRSVLPVAFVPMVPAI